jgi:hypothetical protein
MTTRSLLGAVLLCMAAACDRRTPMAGIDTVRPEPAVEPRHGVYLSVSSLAPRAGDTVVVAATLADDSIALGSFRVRLAFDATRIRYAGELPVGGMRVVNPARDSVVVVGVAGSSPEHRLFELRFRVIDATALQSLLLRVDELNDAGFSNRAEQIPLQAALVLDAALADGGRGSVSSSAAPGGGKAIPGAPVIDSISPRSGEVSAERVTDIALYGHGFAPSGNVVVFDGAEVAGLLSEAGGTVLRFAAPTRIPSNRGGTSRRVSPGSMDIRVRTPGGVSNAVTFVVKAER